MKTILTLAAAAMIAVSAQAGELDNPTQPNVGQADSTIVVRVNTQTGAVEKLELNEGLAVDQAQALAQDSSVQFEQVAQNNIKSELDQEAGASSWYWYCPTYYSYPSYGNYYNTGFYSYGYWYSSYYSYNYSNYNYYYYQPYYGNNYGYNNGWNYGRRHRGGWRGR